MTTCCLLACLSLLVLFAIPALSEVGRKYKINFKFEGRKNSRIQWRYKDVTACCSAGKREGSWDPATATKEQFLQKAQERCPNMVAYKNFTLISGGPIESIILSRHDLKGLLGGDNVQVEKSVVECRFTGKTKRWKDTVMTLRVFDLEMNPRYGDNLSEAWVETTWVLKAAEGYKKWFIGKGEPATALQKVHYIAGWIKNGVYWPKYADLNDYVNGPYSWYHLIRV